MFLAISEMAVAISVSSLSEKRSDRAIVLPCWRASMMSTSLLMGTTFSFVMTVAVGSARLAHQREALLEVERRRRALQLQAELDHGEGHVGLDADDDRPRAQKLRRLGDAAQRPGGERVDDIEQRDVDDHAARAVPADEVAQGAPQPDQVVVAECRLHRCDQHIALLEDWDLHGRP